MAEQGINSGMGAFIWAQLTANFSAIPVDLSGRTALVTGGNAGLGFETVLHFARNNASRIIIASRNKDKCEAAAQKVYKEVPAFRGQVDVLTVDMTSFKSVVAFCKEVKADTGRLDIFVANAGIIASEYKTTTDGWEETLQINDLSTGLMSLLLLPKLVETGKLPVPEASQGFKPHLTLVSSEVLYWAKFDQMKTSGSLLEALNNPKLYGDGQERYSVSKLLDLFMVREIAKLPAVKSGQVNVNTVNPGLCQSGFRDGMGVVAATIMNWLAWRAEFGARNIYHAATQSTTPGAFINYCREAKVSKLAVSPEGNNAQDKYWKECLELWEELAPGAKQSLEVR